MQATAHNLNAQLIKIHTALLVNEELLKENRQLIQENQRLMIAVEIGRCSVSQSH